LARRVSPAHPGKITAITALTDDASSGFARSSACAAQLSQARQNGAILSIPSPVSKSV